MYSVISTICGHGFQKGKTVGMFVRSAERGSGEGARGIDQENVLRASLMRLEVIKVGLLTEVYHPENLF